MLAAVREPFALYLVCISVRFQRFVIRIVNQSHMQLRFVILLISVSGHRFDRLAQNKNAPTARRISREKHRSEGRRRRFARAAIAPLTGKMLVNEGQIELGLRANQEAAGRSAHGSDASRHDHGAGL